jgi:acetolactate synthase-1/2/3 large subunit
MTTANGKGAISADHPLHAGLPWHQVTSDLSEMANLFSPLLSQADGLLAIGCRFTQLTTGSWTMPLPPSLAQIDIDPAEIGRHYPVACSIHQDAYVALNNLLHILPRQGRQPWAPVSATRDPWRLPGIDLVHALRRLLPPDGIVVADITRLAYILMAEFPVYEPRTFLHPAGSVAMGFGIPAALGAKAAYPYRKVVAVVGDGCFQMSAMELASAVQEKLPIVVILVNDSCLTLIKATQARRYAGRFIGVDLQNPDFALFAKAFGVHYWRADTDTAFEFALAQALERDEVGLIEIRPAIT